MLTIADERRANLVAAGFAVVGAIENAVVGKNRACSSLWLTTASDAEFEQFRDEPRNVHFNVFVAPGDPAGTREWIEKTFGPR